MGESSGAVGSKSSDRDSSRKVRRNGDKKQHSNVEESWKKEQSRYEFEGSKFPKGHRSEREKRKVESRKQEKENSPEKTAGGDVGDRQERVKELDNTKLVKKQRTSRPNNRAESTMNRVNHSPDKSADTNHEELKVDEAVKDAAVMEEKAEQEKLANEGPTSEDSQGQHKDEAEELKNSAGDAGNEAEVAGVPGLGGAATTTTIPATATAAATVAAAATGASELDHLQGAEATSSKMIDAETEARERTQNQQEEIIAGKQDAVQVEEASPQKMEEYRQVEEQPKDVREVAFGLAAEEQRPQQQVGNGLELDTSLSLGLSGSRAAPSTRARSFQSISQNETFSNGVTTSLSLSCSHQFVHNPSCSLASHDNQEFSTATQPVSNEANEQSQASWQRSISARPSFSQRDSGGSRNNKRKTAETSVHSQHSYPKGSLKKHGKAVAYHGPGMWERWNGSKSVDNAPPYPSVSLEEVVCGSLSTVAQKMRYLPGKMIEGLKMRARELLECADKREEFLQFQKRLEARNDLSSEVFQHCHRAQLEILVALRTGIKDFLFQERPLQSSVLVEVFLHLKCRNIHCQNQLPVDNCECQLCSQKNGFCNACMCVVCSNFDFDANTCRWVGCDYCLHWCHTDCGISKAYIRPGQSIRGAAGTSEMQFHCIACGHTSELFGFVKDVFSTCAKEWGRDILSRELDCVRRMFRASEDMRGKQLCWKTDVLLQKLGRNHDVAEVCQDMLKFFEGGEDIMQSIATIHQPESSKREDIHSPWTAKSYDAEQNAALQRALQSYDRALEEKRSDAAEIQHDRARKKAEIEELESMMRIKQAEAKMFQGKADEAAREAEGLQRIVLAKCRKVEEEFNCKKLKLQLEEAEERRKRKFEELQMLQKGSENFEIMKQLMIDLQSLLRNMECAKRARPEEPFTQSAYVQSR